ncbi:hypothetical protein V757_11085 [Pelistega indica]|uniref:Uncharacterized protein n=1 Tax=Pelistega indica TaxID=1414851 RepID=V8FUQ3_9BURK|nr:MULTISPECIES: DUF6710 family protein [Pelistega]ETD67611.1 hypothetical protein V757_11085 [Pelistega indica]
MSILKNIWDQLSSHNQNEEQAFHSFMAHVQKASSYYKKEPKRHHALEDLIRIILKPIQCKHIAHSYTVQPHFAIKAIEVSDFFPFCLPDTTLHAYHKDLHGVLHLRRDIVFPTTWHPSSLISSLALIQDTQNNFEQSTNHLVTLLLPFRIGFVTNGNHSIAQGILKGNGVIQPSSVIDVHNLLPKITFDGRYWLKNENGNVLGQPRYKEFGWVWEAYKCFYPVDFQT